jgi:hypothetical protein
MAKVFYMHSTLQVCYSVHTLSVLSNTKMAHFREQMCYKYILFVVINYRTSSWHDKHSRIINTVLLENTIIAVSQ